MTYVEYSEARTAASAISFDVHFFISSSSHTVICKADRVEVTHPPTCRSSGWGFKRLSEHRVQFLGIAVFKLPPARPHVLLHVGWVGGPRNRKDDLLPREPSQRGLAARLPVLLSDLADLVVGSEPPMAEGEVSEYGDAVRFAIREDVSLHASVDQAVVRLHRGELRLWQRRVRLLGLLKTEVAYTDMADLAGAHELLHRPHRFRDGHPPVGPVNLVEVDVGGTEPPQALLQRLDYLVPVEVDGQHLCCQEDVLPLRLHKRPGDEGFRAVDLGSVHQRHAARQPRLDCLDLRRSPSPPAHECSRYPSGVVVCSHPDLGHLPAGLPEVLEDQLQAAFNAIIYILRMRKTGPAGVRSR